MGEVYNPAFIQDIEHRPNPTKIIEAEGIPVIDLSNYINSENSDNIDPSLVSEIGNACKNWGFFQVTNHGVALEIRQKLENASRKFFGLPLEEKKKVRRDEVNPLGYYESEHTKNVRDWKEVFDFKVENPTLAPASYDPEVKGVTQETNKWPENPPELREACEEYAKEVEKLAYKLMELIAISLGLPRDRFHGFFKDHQSSAIRLNYYPPCPIPDLALGVGRHKDPGALTILAQDVGRHKDPGALTILAQDDVGGLEVKRKSDGEWVGVKPSPNAYIINVGDIIQVWSNDAFESVEHRVVVNSKKERISIPFFFTPAHYVDVKPLEELTNEHNPPRYKPYNWGKFVVTRKRSNFMKLDVENIQIHHFKV